MALNKQKQKGCTVNGRSYPHGSEIAFKGEIMDCIEGRWESVVLVSGI